MVAGPDVFICADCVSVCQAILRSRSEATTDPIECGGVVTEPGGE